MTEAPDRSLEMTTRPAFESVCEVDLIHPEAVSRVLDALPDHQEIRRVAETFGILSDPTRARIVYALALEELCVCDVAAVAGLSMSAASHQLKRLRDRGVVDYRKEGRLAFYRLVDGHVRALMEDGVGHALTGAGA
jgi:ArsR family transcriptional regulator, lead/cadmium/zinc/bismuth-responsive transcriptional repressor